MNGYTYIKYFMEFNIMGEIMSLFNAILYSHELTRQFSNNDLGKFTSSLAEAKVQLNPHQIEAALFAFNSPYSKGAILALTRTREPRIPSL